MADRWSVVHGSMLSVLPTLPEFSFDACIADAPYELGFMGRAWDRSGIAFRPETWAAVLRVLKPGAHLVSFGGTRTVHRIACAIEDAGFEIRDSLEWTYGSGFPKSLNVGEGRGTALKPAHEPIILARRPLSGTVSETLEQHGTGALNIDACRVPHASAADLKAHEDQVASIKARGGSMDNSWKNSSDLANANDVSSAGRWPPNFLLTHSAACKRVGTKDVKANPSWDTPERECESTFTGAVVSQVQHGDGETETVEVFECAPDCPVLAMDRQSGQLGQGRGPGYVVSKSGGIWDESSGDPAGALYGDKGGSSRFFPRFEWEPELDDIAGFLYCAKAARAERDLGLDGFEPVSGGEATNRKDGSAGTKSPRAGAGRNGGARNTHPTVKPVALMRWLCRLITPPGGIVVDPFCGSGTTGIAALLEGLRFYGIELNDTHEEPFASISRARIAHVAGGPVPLPESAPLRPRNDVRQGALF
ncbi:MAG TPA: DNA methyltransferase [Polyangiaceae bacterium]|nr:DNA methyltransferase [Polyangiaceae bacterium]